VSQIQECGRQHEKEKQPFARIATGISHKEKTTPEKAGKHRKGGDNGFYHGFFFKDTCLKQYMVRLDSFFL